MFGLEPFVAGAQVVAQLTVGVDHDRVEPERLVDPCRAGDIDRLENAAAPPALDRHLDQRPSPDLEVGAFVTLERLLVLPFFGQDRAAPVAAA